MPPKAVHIEEADSDSDAFDDDTDLPLPGSTSGAGKSLPNLGPRGALLEEIGIEMETTGGPEVQPLRRAPIPHRAPVPSSQSSSAATPSTDLYSMFAAANAAAGGGRDPQFVDASKPEMMDKYKKWTCIYPIYIDAKRAYGIGQRRIPREKSVWWPRSQDILTAVATLNLHALHEPQKTHPRDWENPGRVKVLWKKDGRLVNPSIRTKKKLFEMIGTYIQSQKPDQVPHHNNVQSTTPAPEVKTPKSKSKRNRREPHLPKPPNPLPPMADRYGLYSPLVVSGTMLEAWKVGTADKPAEGAPVGQSQQGAGKGKRKIIRIRA